MFSLIFPPPLASFSADAVGCLCKANQAPKPIIHSSRFIWIVSGILSMSRTGLVRGSPSVQCAVWWFTCLECSLSNSVTTAMLASCNYEWCKAVINKRKSLVSCADCMNMLCAILVSSSSDTKGHAPGYVYVKKISWTCYHFFSCITFGHN